MGYLYFFVNIVLLLLALGGGFLVGRCRKKVWIPLCLFATLAEILFDYAAAYPEVDAWFMIHPDYVYFQTSKTILFGFFLFGVAISLYSKKMVERKASGDSDENGPMSREERVRRALVAFSLMCVMYLAFKFHWMLFRTNYTAEDLPTVWGPGRVCMQTTSYTCVAASLTTTLDRLGVPAMQHEMARLALVRPHGGANDLHAMRALMLKLDDGYRIEVRRMQYDELASLSLPAMTSTRLSFPLYHSVPILEWTPEYIILGDPSRGLSRIPREEFEKVWTHIVLPITPPGETLNENPIPVMNGKEKGD
jgi:predicted double-glycine peptidase